MRIDLDSIDNYAEISQYWSQKIPNSVAFTFLMDGEDREQNISYQEVDQQARAIAVRLRESCKPGDRALLCYPPGIEIITALIACFYSGIIAVPAYLPRKKSVDTRLDKILNDSQACIVLSKHELLENLQYCFSLKSSGDALRYLGTDSVQPVQDVDLDHDQVLALLQYTSGSTGTPKGIEISHQNILMNSHMMSRQYNREGDTVVSWLPPFHDMGLMGKILVPFFCGVRCVFMPPIAFIQKPIRWLMAISKYKATISGGPNFGFDLCVERIAPEQKQLLDLSSWRSAPCGAEQVRPKTYRNFFDHFAEVGFNKTAFSPCYGMAESTLFLTGSDHNEIPIFKAFEKKGLQSKKGIEGNLERPELVQEIASVGCPEQDQHIAIVDPDSLQELPQGGIGEIWASSPNVARGYWQRPELTQATFNASLAGSKEQFLRTGDLGFLYENNLYITGRAKEVVIIRGINYYPQDIEHAIEQDIPEIEKNGSAAFSIDFGEQEQLMLVHTIKRKYLRQEDWSDLYHKICTNVNENFGIQVEHIILIPPASLPKTSSGKIERISCRKMFLSEQLKIIDQWQQSVDGNATPKGTIDQTGQTLPKKENIESFICQWISQKTNLSLSSIDTRAPFEQFTLDSIKVVELSGELERVLGISVSPTLIYDYPNIELVAQHLSGEAKPIENQRKHAVDSQEVFNDSIAIVGTACRFPGAKTIDEFWELIQNGQESISEIPADRWNVDEYFDAELKESNTMNTRWGGFLERIDMFDNNFFQIPRAEANYIDPQQRLLLETAWEALENAGISTDQIKGSLTGVFCGMCSNDYFKSMKSVPPRAGTGIANSIAANRISYVLDLEGPSIVVDTACSSSLVSVHLACQSLKLGESDLAIAGGANIILSPELTIAFSQAGMMAPDGKCKSFDAAANGYVRGEGCGVVVLKRLKDAREQGDRILGVIRGSAINQDGRSNGITAPNGVAQQKVIQYALKNAKVLPHEIDYIEAHGSGTSLGDAIELESLGNVLGTGRSENQKFAIGSVKANIGHLEAAAGIAGLIKVILMLKNQHIPPQPNFETPNQHVDFSKMHFFVPSKNSQQLEKIKLAGISSFGFGGTNIHMVLENADEQDNPIVPEPNIGADSPQFLAISAKNETALRKLAERYKEHLAVHNSPLANVCFTANTGRGHLRCRYLMMSGSKEILLQQLECITSGEAHEAVFKKEKTHVKPKKVGFLFVDGPRLGMKDVEKIFDGHPSCQKIIADCKGHGKLLEVVNSEVSQFAFQCALFQLWKSLGIVPDLVIGKGLAAISAAHCLNKIDLEEALLFVQDYSCAEGEQSRAVLANATSDQFKILDQQTSISETIEGLDLNAYNTFLEIGTAETHMHLPDQCNWLGSSATPEYFWLSFTKQLAFFYVNGLSINWNTLYQNSPRLCVELPSYPFQRVSCWVDSD